MVTLTKQNGFFTVIINGFVAARNVTRQKAQEIINEYDFG